MEWDFSNALVVRRAESGLNNSRTKYIDIAPTAPVLLTVTDYGPSITPTFRLLRGREMQWTQSTNLCPGELFCPPALLYR